MENSDPVGQQNAESEVERFRRNLGPFVVAAEATRMPMIFTDALSADNRIIFANDSLLGLTGYSRDELLGLSLDTLVAPDSKAAMVSTFIRETHGDSFDIHYSLKDGRDFWASTFVSPVCDDSGAVVQHFVSLVDLTGHRDELARATTLIDELNHRVKNTLATVLAIVSQALRAPLSADGLREAIESRVFALSRSHDLLTQMIWRDAGLHDLLMRALEPFGASVNRSERILIDGENIGVPPNTALALGIAFHELATNAVKCGSLSAPTGLVQISCVLRETRLILFWKETGGPPVTAPSRKGFGSQVIERGLTHELQAAVELLFLPGGVTCTIDMPAPKGSNLGQPSA